MFICYATVDILGIHLPSVQSILAIVWPILVCQNIVAGQQRILIISSVLLSIVITPRNTVKNVTIQWTGLLDWNTGLDYWTDIFLVLHILWLDLRSLASKHP